MTPSELEAAGRALLNRAATLQNFRYFASASVMREKALRMIALADRQAGAELDRADLFDGAA